MFLFVHKRGHKRLSFRGSSLEVDTQEGLLQGQAVTPAPSHTRNRILIAAPSFVGVSGAFRLLVDSQEF